MKKPKREQSAFALITSRIDALEEDMEEGFVNITESNLRLSVPYVRDEGKISLGLKLENDKIYIYSGGTSLGYITIIVGE